jgi:dephospho-CoA kinase
LLDALAEQYGTDIILPDGSLDRQALANRAFAGPEAVKALNKIVHPAVGVEIARRLTEEADTDHLVVLDVPLLVESGRDDMAGLVVVDVDPEVAVRRLVEHRGMREDDVRARMARQATREDRVAKADVVIDNSGSVAELEAVVAEAWPRLVALGADVADTP